MIPLIIVAIVFSCILSRIDGRIKKAVDREKNLKINTEAPRHSEFVRIVDRDETKNGVGYAYIIENTNGARNRVWAMKESFAIKAGDEGIATYFRNYKNEYVLERFEIKRKKADDNNQ